MRAPEKVPPPRAAAAVAPAAPAVSLEQYAVVLAARDEGASLEVALEAARVPPGAWPSAEEERSRWLLASAADPEVMRAFDAAMKAARDALRRPVPPLDEDIAAWGRWLCAWSTAADPTAALDRQGLRMSDVLRLTEHWAERMRDDRPLAERFAAEMQGNGPPPAVHPGRSPLLVAAEAAVAARGAVALEPHPEPLPSLLGPLPDDTPAAPAAPAPDTIAAPSYSAPVQGAPAMPAAARPELPSFMASGAAPGNLSGWTVDLYAALCAQLASDPASAEATFSEYGLSDVALRAFVDQQMLAKLARDPAEMATFRAAHARYSAQRPSPAAASAPPAASRVSKHVTRPMAATPDATPLPFDPSAKGAPIPSRGPQMQSGMTGDVDVSAIVRKVIAFGPPGAPAAPPAGRATVTSPPAPVPPASVPASAPPAPVPLAPVPLAPVPPAPVPPAGPPPPPLVPARPPPASYGETTDVDIAAIARRVTAFEKAPGAAPRPGAAAEGPVPSQGTAAPPGKRLVRFDPNTGAPLATPYWEDVPAPPKKT